MPVRFWPNDVMHEILADSDISNKPPPLQTGETGKTLLDLGESRLPSVQIKIVPQIKETAPASVLDKFAATGFREKEVLSEK